MFGLSDYKGGLGGKCRRNRCGTARSRGLVQLMFLRCLLHVPVEVKGAGVSEVGLQ